MGISYWDVSFHFPCFSFGLHLFVPKTPRNDVNVLPVESEAPIQEHEISSASVADEIQGTYVVSKMGSQYLESVMILRRLLLGATSLLHNSIIQITTCIFLCIIFPLHHVYVQPFVYNVANMAESFSLLLLCIASVISLLKSVYTQMGVVPDGPNINVFKFLTLNESLLILHLICFIIVFEIINRFKNRKSKDRK